MTSGSLCSNHTAYCLMCTEVLHVLQSAYQQLNNTFRQRLHVLCQRSFCASHVEDQSADVTPYFYWQEALKFVTQAHSLIKAAQFRIPIC